MLAVVGLSNLLALALATALVGAVYWRRVWGRNPVGGIGWFDAGLKTAVIVVATIMFVAYLPSRVLQTGTVSNFSRPVQDLVGSTVWGIGFVVVLTGLWYLRRERRA
jgi:hypothetical protein